MGAGYLNQILDPAKTPSGYCDGVGSFGGVSTNRASQNIEVGESLPDDKFINQQRPAISLFVDGDKAYCDR